MYLSQRQEAIAAVLVAIIVHDKRAGREVRCADINAIAANESGRCSSHRQNQILGAANGLFRKYTGLYNTVRQIDRAGLCIGCIVGCTARRVVDGIADPRSMTLAAAAPNAVKLIAVFQHLNGGIKSKCFRSSRCTQRLAR